MPTKPEPFCYIREEWFHYEQCSEGDDGAIACYTEPPTQPDVEGKLNLALTTLKQIQMILKNGYTYQNNEYLDEVIRELEESDDNRK